MNYLLLVASCLLNGTKSIFAKKSNTYLTEKHNIYTYNFYMFVIAFLIMLFINRSNIVLISMPTVLMAVIYGLALVFAQIFLIKAMNNGEVSVSTLFYSCGFLVPTFFSVIIYKELLGFLKLSGIILILVSFFVSVEKGKKGTVKWLAPMFMAFFCNGIVGVMQKVFSMSEVKGEQGAFMAIAFLIGAIVTFIIMPKKEKSFPSGGFLKMVSGSGTTLGLVNAINVYISGVLPGVVVFPVVNGGGIIVSALLARIIIKEKISVRKTIGIFIGLIGIVLVAL